MTVVVVARWRAAGRSLRSWLPLVVGAIVVVALAFFGIGAGLPTFGPLGERLKEIIVTLSLGWGLATFSTVELALAAILSLVLLVLVVLVVRERRSRLNFRPGDELLLFAILAFLAVALSPGEIESGGSFVTQRLALFPAFGLVLWLAGQQLPGAAIRGAGIVFMVVAVALAGVRLPKD